ncbi:hypothetical protein PRZ48_008669 [Zasmidium cellare]|uniref:Prenylated rab acceptor 1 n=1 Tax=Zasmidium cellare TaxID=395010 RepID=A0ABR0EG69_ZASCE|nr:hypothetical protein PRZ48_008669 [Zasmidium cellare]
MGRPPGAHSGNRRRAYPQDWELRDRHPRYAERFEELESEEDDGQGVILDPHGYGVRDARPRGFAGDALYFDGYDLGRDRTPRRGMYDDAGYDDYISEEEEYLDQRSAAYQTAVRDKEESLLQSALDRIARARVKGKTNVNLSQDEMEALERRRNQQPEPASTLASPPATPAKSKVKASSRTSSASSLTSQKTRKKSSGGIFGSPAKSNSKAKVQRKNSVEQAQPYPIGAPPPGIMVPGPNGVPVYAPIYYGPPSPEFARAGRSQSGGGSRSSSKHSRRESTPPEQFPPMPPRYYPNGVSVRPDSQGSNRSLPDDIDWYPPPPSRTRSASNAQYAGYRGPPPDDYDMAPPMPAAQGRRHVSGPPDVRYSNLRRAPQSSSPLAQRNATPGQGSGLRRVETSSSSSSDDQGVQVDIVPDDNGGYTVRSAPAAAAPAPTPVKEKPTGNETRKRKGGRR